MTTHTPFVFELSFDVPDDLIPVIPEEVKQPLLYTQDDMNTALINARDKGRAIGFEEGFVQGELKAITERQLQIQAAFVKIYEDIEKLLEKEAAYEQQLYTSISELTQVIVQKVFPTFCMRHGANELMNAIHHILDTLVDPQPLVIQLAPAALGDIQEKIADIQARYANKVVLQENKTLKLCECVVEWNSGGARWSQNHLLTQIEGLLGDSVLEEDSEPSP